MKSEMGTLRCDLCLGNNQRAIPSPFLPPLLHKHLGILICGEILCCEVCSQKIQDWDFFASQTTRNLAISHPTAEASLQERIEKIGLLTAKLQQDTWGITSTAMGLQNNVLPPTSETELPSPVTTNELLVDKHEVFGCLDAQVIDDDQDMSEEVPEYTARQNFADRFAFALSPSEDTVQDTLEDMKPFVKSETCELLAQYSCAQCHKQFLREEVLNLHMKIRHNTDSKSNLLINNKTKQNIPLCPKCNIKFSCNQYLLNHVMEYHAKEIEGHFCCIFCSQLLKSPGSLKYHTKKHFNSTLFMKCKFCPKHLSSKESLDQHVQCEHYQLLEDKKNNMIFDKQQCVYICPLCYKGISSKHNLEGHLRTCKDSLKTSYNIYNLRTDSHISSILKFTCEFCYRVLTSEKKLHHHFYRCHHDNNQRDSFCLASANPSFSCEFCDAKLISKLFLQYHLQRRHLTSKSQNKKMSNQCKFCGIMYSSSQMLRYHIQRRHNEVAPNQNIFFKKKKAAAAYLCTFCKTPMCSKQGLQKHIFTYHSATNKNSKFPCTICSNGFDSKAGLFHHMRHHPPMKNTDQSGGSSTKHSPTSRGSKKAHASWKRSSLHNSENSNYNTNQQSIKGTEDSSINTAILLSKETNKSNLVKKNYSPTAENEPAIKKRATRSSVKNFFNSARFNAIKIEAEARSSLNYKDDSCNSQNDISSIFNFGNITNNVPSQNEGGDTSHCANITVDNNTTIKIELNRDEEAETNESQEFDSISNWDSRENSSSNTFQQLEPFNAQQDLYDNKSSINTNTNEEDVKPFVCQVCFTILHSEFARKKHDKKCQGVKSQKK